MITVEAFLTRYLNLPDGTPPSQEDLMSFGKFVGHHFRHYWAPANFKTGEPIPDCGFMVEGRFVINFYPDSFEAEMTERANVYFLHKPTVVLVKQKRVRIPVKKGEPLNKRFKKIN